MLVACVEVCFK